MAHIQVQRRSMRPEEYIGLRYGWLKRKIYEPLKEITPVYIRNAHQTGDNTFDFYDESPVLLKRGELCYSPDGSVFFSASAQIGDLPKENLCLYYKTSSEVIVKINGSYAGGFDPNRCAVDLMPYTEESALQIEMLGFNRSKPDDERNNETSAGRGCRQVFNGLFISQVNREIQALCFDLELFTDMIASDLFPEDYRAYLIRETNAALNLIDFEAFELSDVTRARTYIEKKIYEDKTYRGSGRVALVAHSHLDLAYYWRRCHTVQKNLRTVLLQMRLMDRYPDFTYCHTQPFIYETLERYYPAVFAELKEKVAAGQFEPVGAMYVEPDCNLPNAESLVRQCLYGQLFYREKFGFTVENCWLPDVFGNSWILPQILKKSGVSYFVSNKMSTWNDTNRFPHNHFIWRGIDGTEIYACVPPTHFITWNEPSQVANNWAQFLDKDTGTQTLNMFGYGDGGSGPTEEMIELMERFRKLSVMPETRHVTAKQFLEDNFTPEKAFAVWDGELYLEMHRGTFTTKGKLKEYNRRLEEKLRAAELLCVLRAAGGAPYPAEEIRALYKRFLVNQFHDILPGSHITPVYRDAIRDYEEIEAGLDALLGSGESYFNPLNCERHDVEFLPEENGAFVREGMTGDYRQVRFGALSGGEVLPWADAALEWIDVDANNVKTPYYCLKLAPDGSFQSLFDEELQREWVRKNADFNKLRLYDDKPGNYDAWDILPDYLDNERPLRVERPLSLQKVTPVCAEFVCVLLASKSRIERRIRLFRHSRKIEVEHIVNWQESHKLLKAHFCPDVLTREAVCDTSAGFIRRPLTKNTTWEAARFECCAHKWFDLSEAGGGVAVLNRCKYGVGLMQDGVSLSLLRATERPDPQSDLGEHDFSYVILPHAGDHLAAQINREALIYNAPLLRSDVRYIPAIFHCFGELHLQAIKQSEDGARFVVRLCETDGRRGTLHFPKPVSILNLLEEETAVSDVVSFRPFEILTLGFDDLSCADRF